MLLGRAESNDGVVAARFAVATSARSDDDGDCCAAAGNGHVVVATSRAADREITAIPRNESIEDIHAKFGCNVVAVNDECK